MDVLSIGGFALHKEENATLSENRPAFAELQTGWIQLLRGGCMVGWNPMHFPHCWRETRRTAGRVRHRHCLRRRKFRDGGAI